MGSGDYHPEGMAEFFDRRTDTYDAHMEEDPKAAYWEELVGKQLPATSSVTEILDLGCGTGRELPYVFRRQPNARILCMDLSAGMIRKLLQKYPQHAAAIETLQLSYFDYGFPSERFDHVIACATMHHWLPERKRELYRRVHSALKKGGSFVICDYFESGENEAGMREKYLALLSSGKIGRDGYYHIDIPSSVATERDVLRDAGVGNAEIVEESYTKEWNTALIVAGS